MIRIFLTFALGMGIICAQPTFSHVPYSVGMNYDYNMASNTLTPGASGAGVTWDYSAWTLLLGFSQEVIAVAGSPYAGDFPTATTCIVTDFGVMGTLYSYGIQTSTEFTSLGQRDLDPLDFTTPKVEIAYPLSYGGSTAVFPYQEVGGPMGSTQFQYDGFGTLITPAGSYSSIMRIREIDFDGSTYDTTYFYFDSSSLFPVAAIDQDGSGGYWRLSASTGLEESEDFLVRVFPSPAHTVAHIACGTPQTDGNVSLYDINGREISQITIEAGMGNVQVQGLPAGVYIIGGVVEGHVIAERLIIE